MHILRKYGVATRVRFPLIEAGAQDYKSGATVAAGDFQISKDDGTFANTATTTPTEIATSSGYYYLPLSATEMQAANIVIRCVDQTATKEWEDQSIIIDTYGNASAEHAFDLDTATQGVDVVQVSGDSTAADNLELAYDGTGYAGGTTKPLVTLADGVHGGSSAVLTLSHAVINRSSTGNAISVQAADGDSFYINASGYAFEIICGYEGIAIQSSGGDGINIVTTDAGCTPVRLTAQGTGESPAVLLASTNANTVIADHIGTDGKVLLSADAQTGVVIADAVWDEALSGHQDAGSAGKALDQIPGLIASIFIPSIQKNTAFSNFEFSMVDTADHVTPKTGLTIIGYRSLDGGAPALVGGTFTEIGNGLYKFDAVAADTNCNVGTWRFTASGADDTLVTFLTKP